MASKAILFTKEDCLPCSQTKLFISDVCDEQLVHDYLVVMKKENHSALVAAYELELFPTLLLVNSQGEESNRIVGGKNIRRELPYILQGLQEAGQ
jgi:hypothetical protein